MRLIATGLLMLAAIAIFALLAGIPVYFLWNWLCPRLFHLPEVSFWEALGLSALSSILFKSPQANSTHK